jgi:hypothetical protein
VPARLRQAPAIARLDSGVDSSAVESAVIPLELRDIPALAPVALPLLTLSSRQREHRSCNSDAQVAIQRRDAVMSSVDYLILDAKQAILEEQHRRYLALQQAGRLTEAKQQYQVTLKCAVELLNHSLEVLKRIKIQRPESNA